MRIQGKTYQQIGDALGVTLPRAYQLVSERLATLETKTKEDAEKVRQLEVERLDFLLEKMMEQAADGDQGAVDRILRIQERRTRYLGLDAPTKADITSGGQPLPQTVILFGFNNDNDDDSGVDSEG